MPYDEGLAERLRDAYQGIFGVEEKKMFGGIAFMVNNHMSCGVVKDGLMCRVGPKQYETALKEKHVREMDFTGKPLTGFVYVDAEGFAEDEDLQYWVNKSLDFVGALPPKEPKTKKPKKKASKKKK